MPDRVGREQVDTELARLAKELDQVRGEERTLSGEFFDIGNDIAAIRAEQGEKTAELAHDFEVSRPPSPMNPQDPVAADRFRVQTGNWMRQRTTAISNLKSRYSGEIARLESRRAEIDARLTDAVAREAALAKEQERLLGMLREIMAPPKKLPRIVGEAQPERPPEVTAQPVTIPGPVAAEIRAYAARYPYTEVWGYLIGRDRTAERAAFLPIEYGEFDGFRLADADEAGEVDKIKSAFAAGERVLGAIHKHNSPLLMNQVPKNILDDSRYDLARDRGIPSFYDVGAAIIGPDEILLMVDPAGPLRQWRRQGTDGAEEITPPVERPGAISPFVKLEATLKATAAAGELGEGIGDVEFNRALEAAIRELQERAGREGTEIKVWLAGEIIDGVLKVSRLYLSERDVPPGLSTVQWKIKPPA